MSRERNADKAVRQGSSIFVTFALMGDGQTSKVARLNYTRG
jgi:hypothetical protein